MRSAAPTALSVTAVLPASPAHGQDVSDLPFRLRGAGIVVQDYDKTYLGKLACACDGDSIFNDQGACGGR